jgi:hypothetical protein
MLLGYYEPIYDKHVILNTTSEGEDSSSYYKWMKEKF